MRDNEAVAAMLCPVCKVGLSMSDRQGIEIDYCPQCRGVWLDRGELDKIVERSTEAAPPQSAPQPQPQAQPPMPPMQGWSQPQSHGYGGDRHYDPRYGYKRKKSFLQELFD